MKSIINFLSKFLTHMQTFFIDTFDNQIRFSNFLFMEYKPINKIIKHL